MSADECDDGVSEEHTGPDESDFGIVLSRGDHSPMLSGESTLSHIILRAHGKEVLLFLTTTNTVNSDTAHCHETNPRTDDSF